MVNQPSPSDMRTSERSVRGLAESMRNREISPVDLLNRYLAKIDAADERGDPFAAISRAALNLLAQKAERADEEELGPLHGVPVAVDDLIEVANLLTTFGCRVFEDHVPETDAVAVRRLKAAGAYVLGKTRTSEFGIVDDRPGKAFRAPVDATAYGIDGAVGASLAVAAGHAPAAIALDVHGNALLPAAYAGVFAFRPTHGAIPVTPIESGASGLQDIAIISNGAEDAACLLQELAGHCETDPYSLDAEPADFISALEREVGALRLAHVSYLWGRPADERQSQMMQNALSVFQSMGCRMERKRPPVGDPMASLDALAAAELYVNRGASLETGADSLSPKLREMLERGSAMSAAEYIRAKQEISGFRAIMAMLLGEFDLFVTLAIGNVPDDGDAADASTWRDCAPNCAAAAASGLPVALLPIGASAETQRFPSALMVFGKPGCDDLVLSACSAYQKATRIETGESG